MAGKIPGTDDLAEVVRVYAQALIASGADRQQGKEQRTSTGPAFGDKESGKKKRKKKKKVTSFVIEDEKLLASLRGKPPLTEQQLAELAKAAKQAIEQASEQAGEPAAYIVGMLVPSKSIGKNSPFRTVERYKKINGWE